MAGLRPFNERIIAELWAWVVIDQLGNEGVLRRDTPIGTQPMIADSRDKLESFAFEAHSAAQGMKLKVYAVRFVRAEEGGGR